MRESVTRERLLAFMKHLAESAPRGRRFRVFVVGGGTAVEQGWRESTIDVDLYADDEAVFLDIQRIKETQQVNVEFARPEHFVPPLAGAVRPPHLHRNIWRRELLSLRSVLASALESRARVPA